MAETIESKIKKNRSAAYPGVSLKEAIDLLSMIHSQLGSGPFDRQSASEAIGHKTVTGASSTKIAALVHFGLLERDAGGYRESDLGDKILNHLDDGEYQTNVERAFKNPTLFSKLLREFGDKALPQRLDIILARHYKITEQAAKVAASVFKSSAEFSGVLRNGFLHNSASTSSVSGDQADDAEPSDKVDSPTVKHENAPKPVNKGYVVIRAHSGVTVAIPNEVVEAATVQGVVFKPAIDTLNSILKTLKDDANDDEDGGDEAQE